MGENTPSSFKTPKFCPQCGTPVKREGAKFCTQCGKSFKNRGTPTNNVSENKSSTPAMAPTPSAGAPGQTQPTGGSGGQQAFPGGQQVNTEGYASGTRTSKTYNMITPNDIRGVDTPLFVKEEFILIGIFALVATGSHLFRYLLIYDAFPNFWNLIVPLPLYAISVAVILAIQKYLFHDKGVSVEFEADRFDYTRSLVFSSFFLTLLPPRPKISRENSKLPDEIFIPQSGDYGMKYEPVSRAVYLGKHVRPRMHFFANLFVAVFALLLVIFYFRIDDPNVKTIFRFVSLYVSSYVVVELAPVYGRNNDQAGEYGRIRSLLIFIFAMILFLTSLLGERFFVALQNLQ